MEYTVTAVYSGLNSIKSPASDSGNVSEPMPVSHVGIMRIDQCVVQYEWWRCQYLFAYVVAAVEAGGP